MRTRDSKRLVIDTDVAQSSGGESATDPRAINCRDFLIQVRVLDYRVVMTKEINDEWRRHRSGFAFEWRASMYARRRIEHVDPPAYEELQDKVTSTTIDADEIENMEKDFHLLQAALATDQTITSLDETIRRLFKRASQQVGEIRNIIWVNPDKTAVEHPIAWLQNGAPPEAHRKLYAENTI